VDIDSKAVPVLLDSSNMQLMMETRLHEEKTLYPTMRIPSLIVIHYAVRAQTKAQHPEDLEKEVIATVFPGDMKPKKTVRKIAELMQ